MASSTKILGQQGESAVARWLESHGFTILARNYTIKEGEVDLIAQYKEIIAFIEVKTRMTEYFSPAEAVTYSKQRKIIKAAKHFALKHKLFDHVLRFDVATVVYYDLAQNKYSIGYIKDAFRAN